LARAIERQRELRRELEAFEHVDRDLAVLVLAHAALEAPARAVAAPHEHAGRP
jgi:hypothetical protein